MVYDVNLALPCVPMIIEEPRAGKCLESLIGDVVRDESVKAIDIGAR